MPIAAYVRGITSDLSLTSVLLACLSLGQRHGGLPPTARRESMLLYGALAAAAVFLYPTALGWGDWDAYRPGWGDWALWAILLALALASWMREFRLLPVAIACALLGWSISLMESTNLWDYLMDPWLAIAAILACVRTGLGHSFAIFRLNNAHRRVEANFEPSPRDSRTP
ncbi:MAG: hypothetical protein JWP47_1453 [Polaromonas sp.]|nr:hypothetical protein [Polaromonas sp.]